jgi:hypothetical protein
MPPISPLPKADWQDIHRDVPARLAPDGPVDPLVATFLPVLEMVEAVLPMPCHVIEDSNVVAKAFVSS